ncbi:MAG: universal stress protein [Thermoplasmataceae archaeon]
MKVLVAFDNSAVARKALKFALRFKDIVDEYVICYVSPLVVGAGPSFDAYVPPSMYQHARDTSEGVINAAKEIVELEKINATFLKLDAPGEQIARVMTKSATERSVDLIITGTRKLSGLSKVLLGSVSSEIIKLSQIPVLVVPPD